MTALRSFAPAITLLLALAPAPALALSADLGSNGSYGPINVTTDTVLALPADGVIHATTVNIAAGATLSFSYTGIAHPGVVILATGNVTINGTLDVSGADSTATTAGRAGPGGSSGGAPSALLPNFPTFDPRYLLPNSTEVEIGLRPRGGDGGNSAWVSNSGAACATPGAGGGGGGGSLVVTSNTRIQGTGRIDVGGGAANATRPAGCPGGTTVAATPGDDGNVRLAAPAVALTGATVVAQRVLIGAVDYSGGPVVQRGTTTGAGTLTTSAALVRFPALPVATIVGINGTAVTPSTAVQIPTTTAQPWTIKVHVEGCTRTTLTANVHSSLAADYLGSASAALSNPTGSDDIDVSLNTGASTVDARRQAAVLFPAAWCGAATYP